MKRLFALLMLSLLAAPAARADVVLPHILQSGMVLQQQTDVAIWGWAGPTENVTVAASWGAPPVRLTVAGDGNWRVILRTPAAGGPYTITVRGRNEVVLNDVLIGEVWLCSGQSNMERSASEGVLDARAELPKAANPNIRFFKVPKVAADAPQIDCRGNWQVCDSLSLKRFSAVGYFFGKRLQHSLHVPIGLIDASWGGSYMDCWVPAAVTALYPDTRRSAETMPAQPWNPNRPGVLYNGMLAPLGGFPLAGVIWYQGESNRHDAAAYRHLTRVLVETWRGLWQRELPFYAVQIAPFAYDNRPGQAALVREAQAQAARDLPKSGLVVTTDLVDNINDIHPVYKREVGNRLAGWALAETYGRAANAYQSPQYRSLERSGAKLRVAFDYAPRGLVVRGPAPAEFEVAGADQVFSPARARLRGSVVEVWADAVPKPVAVRFAFRDAPQPNLFSREGLPVMPFRTDDWDLGKVAAKNGN